MYGRNCESQCGFIEMLEMIQVVFLVKKKNFFETRRGVARIREIYANARRFYKIFLWPMRARVIFQ